MRIDVNNDAVVRHTATLEKLRKSALPNAVRSTINNAAFDVKQKTMPASADAQFIKRSANFFKANSSVDMATGFDVNKMRAKVGFIESRLRLGSNNLAVQDLEHQEYSGSLEKKSFIPLDEARVSGYKSLVKPANRLSKIFKSNRVVVANNLKGVSKKDKFIKAVHKAGVGGYVLGSSVKGENFLSRVDSIRGERNFSTTALYTYQKGRKVKVSEHPFMRTASVKSGNKMNDFFIKNANFQINKFKK